MKKVAGVVIGIFLCAPAFSVQAETFETAAYYQVQAISEYLERTYGEHHISLTSDELRQVVTDGTAWIVAAQTEAGRFAYEYAPYADEYLSGDSIVRQAGTLYSLAEVYRRQSEKDETLAQAIERGIDYMESMSIADAADTFLCVRNTARSERCDLGAVALALSAVLDYVAAAPDRVTVYESLITKYATFLQSSRFGDRGFRAKYYLGDGFSNTESPFYTGETMLALVKYYQYTPDESVQETLEEVFVYLQEQEYESPLYLWIMSALKDMQRLWPNEAQVTYAAEFTQERLTSIARQRATTHNYCAPLEGLVSAQSVLQEQGSVSLRQQLGAEVQFWLTKTAFLQVRQPARYRVLPTAEGLQLAEIENMNRTHGGFLTSEENPTQRIDFTQHCVSAYVQQLVDVEGERL